MQLSSEELERYSRQTILPEFGMEGQERLKAARVLIIGTGGLGSPAALYLAAMGLGTIGIIDDDIVSLSNLHRQILYTHDDIGKLKAPLAAERLTKINPSINVIPIVARFTRDNALDILCDYDLVLDGTDNFSTRYLVNDACLVLGIPLISASILRFEGQLTVVGLQNGPCYRCIFPEPPNAGEVPSCSEAGVMGALAGTMGTMMAMEAVKLIAKIGTPLAGRLLLYDALVVNVRSIEIERDPSCEACSVPQQERTLASSYDFDSCALPDVEMSWEAFQDSNLPLIDVREEWEFQSIPTRGMLIPMSSLPDRLGDLPKEEFAVICASGVRSLKAVELLNERGFKAKSIRGGVKRMNV